MSVNAIDCTGLNPTQIANLKNNGVQYVGRYLSRDTWKGLNVGEVANIKAAGLQIFSIYETNPTYAGYFSSAKGKSDALDAYNLAKTVGQPEGTAIYFTVDYDAQAGDFPAILAYFQGIQSVLASYKIGAYASFTVLNYLHQNNAADYWYQTVAWSRGQRCSFLNIYQFQTDKLNWNNTGVNVDFDNIETADIGAWGQQQAQQKSSPFIQVVKALVQTDIRADHDHTSTFIRDAQPGEIFNVIERFGDFHRVILDDKGNSGWIDGNNGANLDWVDNPNAKQAPSVYYVVKSGDILSKIAAANGTTVSQLQAWNGIKDPDKIYAGQKIRVK